MKSHRKVSLSLATMMIILALGDKGIAQESAPPPPLPGRPGVEFGFHTEGFGFVGMMELNGKVVAGAPYSAQATTETTQTLADGNQIVRTETSQIYRDSQGRTRREHTLSTVGPWSASGAPHQMITINDPVAGVHYMLNPQEKTAVKMPAPPPGQRTGPNLKGRLVCDGNGHCVKNSMRREEAQAESTSESLGTQTLDGLLAEGTRVTETIPAGKIGNVKPITIVSERWYSAQLQTHLLTKRSDPRFGETVYKLTNINTADPSPDLFQIPADYTLKEGKEGMHTFRYEIAPK